MSKKIVATTIEEAWLRYAKILPPDATVTQRRETKRAFYAGAQSLYNIQMFHIVNLPEEAGEKALERIFQEFDRFGHEILMGRA